AAARPATRAPARSSRAGRRSVTAIVPAISQRSSAFLSRWAGVHACPRRRSGRARRSTSAAAVMLLERTFDDVGLDLHGAFERLERRASRLLGGRCLSGFRKLLGAPLV